MCGTGINWLGAIIAVVMLAGSSVYAGQVQLDVAMGQPVLAAGKKNTTYVKVGLTGFTLPRQEERPPANVVLVLDKSGSMAGDKIQHARQAAIAALDRLDARDIVSVIAFDQNVEVVLPATKLTDKALVQKAIERIESGGETALFGGVSKAAAEARKFLDRQHVNRLILLSDGQANVGPSSPRELGELGQSFRKEGLAVSTLGLGSDYNEDLMAELARRSDGNHYYIKSASELEKVFKHEFGDVVSVVAQEVSVQIKCAEGIRPVRVLGKDAEISGQNVTVQLNQIYSEQEKSIILEVEVPSSEAGQAREIATTTVTYANMATKTTEKLANTVSATFSAKAAEIEKAENPKVMVECVVSVGNWMNCQATDARDQGKIEEARKILVDNAAWIQANAEKYNNEKLRLQFRINSADAKNLDDEHWSSRRKLMRGNQHVYASDSSWGAAE